METFFLLVMDFFFKKPPPWPIFVFLKHFFLVHPVVPDENVLHIVPADGDTAAVDELHCNYFGYRKALHIEAAEGPT